MRHGFQDAMDCDWDLLDPPPGLREECESECRTDDEDVEFGEDTGVQLFERTMEEEEAAWEEHLRQMEGEGEEERDGPGQKRRGKMLAIEGEPASSSRPEGEPASSSRPERKEEEKRKRKRQLAIEDDQQRPLAIEDRQRIRPTQGRRRIRPSKTVDRAVMERRVQELLAMGERAREARASLLAKVRAAPRSKWPVKSGPETKAKDPKPKVKAKDPEPKAKAKDPEPKAKAQEPEPKAKAKEPEPKAKAKDPEPKAKAKRPLVAKPPAKDAPKAKGPPVKGLPGPKPPPAKKAAKVLPAKARPLDIPRAAPKLPEEPPKAKAKVGTIYPDAPWHQQDSQWSGSWDDWRWSGSQSSRRDRWRW